MSEKYVCIHGHFYQPPRENPWLEAVEVEDSATPFHDWNERINAECYAANTVARLLDDGKIAELINNYESLSFDFGPTLLTWLEDADPQTYEAIIEADRRSVKAHNGHGNGMAQAYNHVILPLANERDKLTQVRWGLADFQHRYGRKPEGMWLPETAVDTDTLEVLAKEGLRFVVLAPHQVDAVRQLGVNDAPWKHVNADTVDTTVPYLCRLPSGRSIAAFFYDGAASRAVAFEGLLGDGNAFTRRLQERFTAETSTPALVHIATDGESYGHHHRYGDMALAYAIRALGDSREIRLTNYGEFLDIVEPKLEARIVEESSWSCAHGVGRWSADCGCTISGGSQAWRKPLREALNWLRDEIDTLFQEKAKGLLAAPWEARDEYINVLLNRSADALDQFLSKHTNRRLEHFDRIDALSLLEMQRHRMLMFTSCGWFFDDCAGLETVQILKYAARAIQLASTFGAPGLEKRFIKRLAAMQSNDPDAGNGEDIYQQRVCPSMVDLRRVVAHHAITRLFEDDPEPEHTIYCYRVKDLDWNVQRHSGTQLAVGRVRVQSQITLAIEDVSYGLLHFGGHDFNCSIRGAVNVEGYDSMRDHILRTYEAESLTEVIHTFDRYFEGRHFGLANLFLEGRRAVLSTVTEGVLAELETSYEEFYAEHRKLFDLLREASFPLPDAFTRTVEFALERRIHAELDRVIHKPRSPERPLQMLNELADEVERRGVLLSQLSLGPQLTMAIDAIAELLVPDWSTPSISALTRLLALGSTLHVEPNLWEVQNALLSAIQQRPPRGRKRRAEVGVLFEQLGISKVVMRKKRHSRIPSAPRS